MKKKLLKIDMKNSLSSFRDLFCSAMKIYPNHLSSSIMDVIAQCTPIVVSAIFYNYISLSTNTTTAPQVSKSLQSETRNQNQTHLRTKSIQVCTGDPGTDEPRRLLPLHHLHHAHISQTSPRSRCGTTALASGREIEVRALTTMRSLRSLASRRSRA